MSSEDTQEGFVRVEMSPGRGGMRGEVPGCSDWMSKLPSELHDKPLWDLVIPGSHDSMSYDLDINSPIIEPDMLKKYSGLRCVREKVMKWAVAQEETIVKQLDAGARYFDLRIAHKPNDKDPYRAYFYHGLYTRTDVETVLKLINDWAGVHPKEILILALSHFKDCDDDFHSHLIKLIKNLFGSKLFDRPDTPTLRSCWAKERNVIVSYDYPANIDLWIRRKITYFYGNSMAPGTVELRLSQDLEKKGPSDWFFVCGLNLTLPEDAGALKYILHCSDTLAKVTQRSLPELVKWMEQQHSKTPMNIVASDLVTHDDFVSKVIQLNS